MALHLLAINWALATPSPPVCPDGATAAPTATWGGACFSLPKQRATSLRQCVERCGEQGMTPACIGSAEEDAFAAELVPDDDWAYIGHYQSDTSGGPAEGWGRCVAGEASGFANWDQTVARNPDDYLGAFPEGCAVMFGHGRWRDVSCVVPAPQGITTRCLCEGPSSPSASFEQDLQVLEAAVEAGLSEVRARVAVVYPVCFLITFLPALLLVGRRRLRRSAREEGEGGAAGPETSQARTALRAARRSAAQRRLRVSGLMAQSGWALNVFGMAPIIKYVTGDPINAVTGPHSFWVVMVFPGLQLFYLALLPTDARAIRTSCALGFASFAGLSVPCALATGGPLTPTRGIPLVVLLLASAAGLGPTLLCRGRCAMQPRQALQRFWLVARLFSLAFGVLFIGWTSADIASYPDDIADKDYGLIAAGATCILCALLSTPANRGRLHRRLPAGRPRHRGGGGGGDLGARGRRRSRHRPRQRRGALPLPACEPPRRRGPGGLGAQGAVGHAQRRGRDHRRGPRRQDGAREDRRGDVLPEPQLAG